MPQNSGQKAHYIIDPLLIASSWIIQVKKKINVTAGIAIIGVRRDGKNYNKRK